MPYLGIEIGGTKLQLAVGDPGEFSESMRMAIDPAQGAAGIRQQIQQAVDQLRSRHQIDAIGIGFGGPVKRQSGITTTSHQIDGWDDFPLASWCQETLQMPAVIGNDCDVAALAEAHQYPQRRTVFYVTVGSGIGGGYVVDGKNVGDDRPAIAEIGHLRPGPSATQTEHTVESVASGWGITSQMRARLAGEITGPLDWNQALSEGESSKLRSRHLKTAAELDAECVRDLRRRCDNDLLGLDTSDHRRSSQRW